MAWAYFSFSVIPIYGEVIIPLLKVIVKVIYGLSPVLKVLDHKFITMAEPTGNTSFLTKEQSMKTDFAAPKQQDAIVFNEEKEEEEVVVEATNSYNAYVPKYETEPEIVISEEKEEEIVVEATITPPTPFVPPKISAPVAVAEPAAPQTHCQATDIDDLCQQLKEALEVTEPQLEKITPLMIHANDKLRRQVYERYCQLYGKESLLDAIKYFIEEKRAFPSLFAFVLPTIVFDALILDIMRKSKIMQHDDSFFWSALIGRTPEEMALLKDEYQNLSAKGHLVLEDFKGTILGGSVMFLLEQCVQARVIKFDEAVHTPAKAAADAEKLYKKGPGRNKLRNPRVNAKLQKEILEIMLSSPAQHLQNIGQAYSKKYGYTLQDFIRASFKLGMFSCGELLHTTLFHVTSTAFNRDEAVADLFHAYLKQDVPVNTSRSNPFLISLLLRHQDRLGEIISAYNEKHSTNKTLRELFESEDQKLVEEWGIDDDKKAAYLILSDCLMSTEKKELTPYKAKQLNFVLLTGDEVPPSPRDRSQDDSKGDGEDGGGVVFDVIEALLS